MSLSFSFHFWAGKCIYKHLIWSTDSSQRGDRSTLERKTLKVTHD